MPKWESMLSPGRILVKDTEIRYFFEQDLLVAYPGGMDSDRSRHLDNASTRGALEIVQTIYGTDSDLSGGDAMQQIMYILSAAVLYARGELRDQEELTRLRARVAELEDESRGTTH